METDRSRIIAYQQCPRQRYLAYHHLGKGLQRTKKSLPLQFGSAFHCGTEILLTETPLGTHDVDLAVFAAHRFLEDSFAAHTISFDGELPADVEAAMAYGREEQMALAEALLRAWWEYEGETFLETFEVIEVEQEGRAQLAQMNPTGECHYDERGKPVQHYADELVLMFRPDALVRDRQSGDLYVVSWKTCATFGKRNVDQARHDQQSISEVWGLRQQYAETALSVAGGYADDAKADFGDLRIEGVLYKWIVKGRRSLDKWDNLYKQQTHLIYGWMKLGQSPEETDWSWCYEYETEEGKTSRLGKGWKKVPIWRDYPGGVKQWIDALASNRVFPRHMDALAQVFPQALPVERRVDEVERWKRQVVQQEKVIQGHLDGLVNLAGDQEEMLDYAFPQYTHSCHSYSGCPFIPICWEGVKAEPGELYQIRTANHPEKGDDE